MKATSRLFLFIALGLSAALVAVSTAIAGTPRWIVEFDEPPAAHWLAGQGLTVYDADEAALQTHRQHLSELQDAFLQALDESGIPAFLAGQSIVDDEGNEQRVDFRYTLVYNGLALEMEPQWVPEVRAMEGVADVHLEEHLFPVMDFSVDHIRAPEVYGEFKELTPFDNFNEGFEGQGIIASIIDTGIEWTHEMFGADVSPPRFGLAPPAAVLGSNEKVIYRLPLSPSFIDDHGHGTHVAATVAGYLGFAQTALLGEESPVHGVAPQARLMDYKVCTAAGSCAGAAIILAIEDSVSPRTLTGFPKPVAHVINISLGGTGGPDSPNSLAVDNAVRMGAIVVSSAGNSGPNKGTVGQPAAARHAIAVGANHDPGPPFGITDEMGSFSSRGPVLGLGQIKPDVTAPGVSILSATVPAGLMSSPTRYIRVSGTSMSGPHVAGAAGLVKQSRLGWAPDLVRTALINTATNLRDDAGVARPDGLEADDVLSQGGGLIDVFAAVNTPALMGVRGDGFVLPGLLGSHSFGEAPVVNSRVTYSDSVDVSLIDVVNEAGDWQLAVINNRDLQFDGVDVELSTDQVFVPAGGSAEFTVTVSFDGDKLREPVPMLDRRTGQTVAQFDTQWYVVATRDDGQSIRMPFHFRPSRTLPVDEDLLPFVDLHFHGNVDDGCSGQGALDVALDICDGPFLKPDPELDLAPAASFGPLLGEVRGGTERNPQDASWTWFLDKPVTIGGPFRAEFWASCSTCEAPFPAEWDLFIWANGELVFEEGPIPGVLFAPQVTTLTSIDTVIPEIRASERITVQINPHWIDMQNAFIHYDSQLPCPGAASTAACDSFLSVEDLGAGGPELFPIHADFTRDDGTPVSFDGSLGLAWEGDPRALGYEVERAMAGGSFEVVAELDGDTTSVVLDDQPDGRLAFRIRMLTEGQIGFFVTGPGNVEEVLVDRREQVDITDVVSSAISNVDLSDGVFSFDLRLTNQSDEDFVPLVEFFIIGIDSASGTVEAINADNGGSGTSPEDPALYDYSQELGDDYCFAAGETTGARRLEFQNDASELFTFDAVASAYRSVGGDDQEGAGGTAGTSSGDGDSAPDGEAGVLRFEVNPLTGEVRVTLLELIDGVGSLL